MDFKRGSSSRRAQSEVITLVLIIAIIIALVIIVAAVIYAFVNRGAVDVEIKGCDLSTTLTLDKNYVYANNDGITYIKISRPAGEGCELKNIRVTFFDYQSSVFYLDVAPPKENSYQVYSFVGANNLVTRGFDNETNGNKIKKLREIQIAPIVVIKGKERVLNVKDKFIFLRDAWCAKFNLNWTLLGFVCQNPYGYQQCKGDEDCNNCCLKVGRCGGADECNVNPPVTTCDNDDYADDGEQCDGDDLNDQDCMSLDSKFIGGTLSCGSDCKFDTSGCLPRQVSTCSSNDVTDPAFSYWNHGENPFSKGTSTNSTTTKTDECTATGLLREYFCLPDGSGTIGSWDFDCSSLNTGTKYYNCQSGACAENNCPSSCQIQTFNCKDSGRQICSVSITTGCPSWIDIEPCSTGFVCNAGTGNCDKIPSNDACEDIMDCPVIEHTCQVASCVNNKCLYSSHSDGFIWDNGECYSGKWYGYETISLTDVPNHNGCDNSYISSSTSLTIKPDMSIAHCLPLGSNLGSSCHYVNAIMGFYDHDTIRDRLCKDFYHPIVDDIEGSPLKRGSIFCSTEAIPLVLSQVNDQEWITELHAILGQGSSTSCNEKNIITKLDFSDVLAIKPYCSKLADDVYANTEKSTQEVKDCYLHQGGIITASSCKCPSDSVLWGLKNLRFEGEGCDVSKNFNYCSIKVDLLCKKLLKK